MKRLLVIALSCLAAFAFAQDQGDKTQPVNPDRPDATNGAGITPVHKFVLEIGYRQASAGGAVHLWGDGPTLRYGVNDRFELRFGAPTYAVGQGMTGWQDTNVGFKWLLKDGGDGGGFRKPSYALQAGTTLPTGTPSLSSKQPLPNVIGIVDWDFGAKGDLGGNLSATETLDGAGGSFYVWTASLSYNHTLNGPLAGFFEGLTQGATSSGHGFATSHIVDTGLQYLLNENCMLDAFVGTGLDRHQQNSFFGAGVSFRF